MTRFKKSVIKAVGKKATRKAGEVLRITSDGRVKVLTTRRTSIRAMDEATQIYGQALQRLANR
jgi:hypothetical protein